MAKFKDISLGMHLRKALRAQELLAQEGDIPGRSEIFRLKGISSMPTYENLDHLLEAYFEHTALVRKLLINVPGYYGLKQFGSYYSLNLSIGNGSIDGIITPPHVMSPSQIAALKDTFILSGRNRAELTH